MKKGLQYKLAILGCASSCLMSVAYANDDDSVIFLVEPDFTDVACGAEPRCYRFVVENTNSIPAEIESFEIVTLNGDEFEGQDVAVLASTCELQTTASSCFEEQILDPEETCEISVIIDPTALDCPEPAFITDGEIERALVLTLDAGAQRQLIGDIDFDVTVLGTVAEFSLLADDIIIHQDGNADEAYVTEPQGQVQVQQDVGYFFDIEEEDDIIFQRDSELLAFADVEVVAGFEDAQAAYDALRDAVYDNNNECVGPTIDLLGDDIVIEPSIYCLVDGDDNDDFAINGRLIFRGNHDSLFVFVMPAIHDGSSDNEDDHPVSLQVLTGTDFWLLTDAGRVNPNNIIFVGSDIITFEPGVNMVGTFLSKGFIATFPDEEMSALHPEGPAVITGRFIALHDCCDERSNDAEKEIPLVTSEIDLQGSGNAFLEPRTFHHFGH